MKRTEDKNQIIQFLGIQASHVGHTEKLISGIGAFTSIFIILYLDSHFLPDTPAYLIVASMGASAVLLFAVPHGPLSQPWALIGGHLISAIIGVSCAKFVPDVFLAAALAVGLSVSVMYYSNCIHPPGGATALTAVISGSTIHELGYQFVLTPVLINVVIILSVAIIFNALFKWRRYPAYLARKQTTTDKQVSINDNSVENYAAITHEDFVYALSEFDSFLDISENDLLSIYNLVTKRHTSPAIKYRELKPGHYYSNGEYGERWSVRQIIDWANNSTDMSKDMGHEQLIYKTVAGVGRRSTGVLTKTEFSLWAKHEVTRDEENWHRVDNS
jgi:CBS-domain-containing membrane protein